MCWPDYKSPKWKKILAYYNTHVRRKKNSGTGLTWLNYHPNFMNILKCVARTTNIFDRPKCINISENIIIFSSVVGSSLLLFLMPNSDKTFVFLKITEHVFPLFCPPFVYAHLFIFFVHFFLLLHFHVSKCR